VKGLIHTVLAVLCVACFGAPALAATGTGKAAPSSARVTLKLQGSGEARSFDGLASAFHELYEQYGGIGFYDTMVLDYSTYGSKQEQLVNAERAYFLVGADKARGAGGELKVVAFTNRDAATRAQRKIGGELRDFDDAWAAVAAHWGVDLDGQSAAAAPVKPAAAPERTSRPARAAEADCFT
jgi:hypothetical protein